MDGSFGALLRAYRDAASLTQEALAERARISTQAVGALERGARRFPHARTVGRIADALELAGRDRDRFVAAARRPGVPKVLPTQAVSRQLPPDIAHFTGREEQLETLIELLGGSSPPAVVAIVGMGGVGKTTLAVHAGHLVAERFRDGHLYIDLRGPGAPLPPREALGLLMHALKAADESIASDLAAAAAEYRSCLAGRRVLVVLDNAGSAEQVVPLLPGSGESAVIVTSRRALDGLPHAHQLRLEVLPERAAVELLESSLGDPRVSAEPGAAAELVHHCGRLPLAVHLAGARLAARRGWPIAHLARRLADARRRLDELDRDDVGVRASIAVTVDHLDKPDALAFAMLGLVNGPAFSHSVTAALLDVSEAAAERVLERFADLHLVDAISPGRYRMHDLVHAYAREVADEMITKAERSAALSRVLELLVAVTWHRHILLVPTSLRRSWAEVGWAGGASDLATAPEASVWLDDHKRLLVEVPLAAEAPPELVVRLSVGLFNYYLSRGYWRDWVELAAAACRAAQQAPDELARVITRMDLGMAQVYLARGTTRDYHEGLDHLAHSLAEFRALEHPHGLATCLLNTGDVYKICGDAQAAIKYGEEALAICRAHPDFPEIEAVVCSNLGSLYGEVGDREKELEYLQRSLRVNETLGHQRGIATASKKIGDHHRAEGRFDQARTALRRSVLLCRQLGDPVGELVALETLGQLHLDRVDNPAAADILREALALAEQLGDQRRQATIKRHLDTALGGPTDGAPPSPTQPSV